jgi:periplasmic divalent cation tolerance protein
MDGLVQVLTTVSTRDEALALAHDAVDAQVAACVQVLGPVTSVYRWDGHVQEEPEFLLLCKAPSARAGALRAFLAEHHPYEVPEIALYEAGAVDPRYLAWATEVTSGQESDPPAAKE